MKHIEKSKSNFNYLKKELKEVNLKIDNLRQLLLDVSDIFIEFYILFNQIMYFISIFLISYCMVHILFEVKGQNETCAINNTKFSKSGTKGKDIGLDFNSLDDKFEIVMEDKKDENHDHIDVKTNTEEITYIVVAENI